jgi:hypothetical protein
VLSPSGWGGDSDGSDGGDDASLSFAAFLLARFLRFLIAFLDIDCCGGDMFDGRGAVPAMQMSVALACRRCCLEEGDPDSRGEVGLA